MCDSLYRQELLAPRWLNLAPRWFKIASQWLYTASRRECARSYRWYSGSMWDSKSGDPGFNSHYYTICLTFIFSFKIHNRITNYEVIVHPSSLCIDIHDHLIHYLSLSDLQCQLIQQGQIQRGAPGARAPLTTKNEAPAPKFYKIEAPEWQF